MVLQGVGGKWGERAFPTSQEKECDPALFDLNCFKCHMNEVNNCPSSGTSHPLTVFSPEPEVTQVILSSAQILHVATRF